MDDIMDDIIYDKLLEDIQKWLSDDGNSIYVETHTDVYKTMHVHLMNTVKENIRNYKVIGFHTHARSYSMIRIQNEQKLMQRILFCPDTSGNYNIWIETKDDIIISTNSGLRKEKNTLKTYNVEDLYDNLKNIIQQKKTQKEEWSIGEYFFDKIPVLSSLQYMMDILNPNKEIVIDI